MDPIRINRTPPPPKPKTIAHAAGQIVIDALTEAGLDPRKAAGVPMVRTIVGAWGRGEYTRAEVVDLCRKVLIINPALAPEE